MRVALAHAWDRLVREERGAVTMIELLLAAAFGAILFVAALAFANVSENQSRLNDTRSKAVLESRDGLERMLREVRTAVAVAGQSPAVSVDGSSLVFARPAAGANLDAAATTHPRTWVRWTCAAGSCRRNSSSAFPPPTGGSTLLTDLANGAGKPVFALVGTNFLRITIQVAVPKQRASQNTPAPVELSDGVWLRNVP